MHTRKMDDASVSRWMGHTKTWCTVLWLACGAVLHLRVFWKTLFLRQGPPWPREQMNGPHKDLVHRAMASLWSSAAFENVLKNFVFKAGPPLIWVFGHFNFFGPWYRKSGDTSSVTRYWKIAFIYTKIEAKVKKPSPSVTICLPWIGHSSTTLGKKIRQAITKGYPKVTPWTIFMTNKAFSGRTNDVSPMLSQSNVMNLNAAVGRRTLVKQPSVSPNELNNTCLPSSSRRS